MRPLFFAAFSSALLFAPASDAIRFAPAEGLALRKTFHRSFSTELDSVSATSDGESTAAEQERSDTGERTLVVTDRYAAMDGARVTRLERTFEEVAREDHQTVSAAGQSHTYDLTAGSELDGETVVFEWNEEEEEYAVRAEDEDVDEALLEDLRFDLDALVLLPPDEVSEGDEWSLDVEELQRFLKPEQDLPLDEEHKRDGETIEVEAGDEGDEPEPEESIDGKVTARYDGTREVDGIALAVIHLEGELFIERKAEGENGGEQGRSTFSQETRVTLALEGECLWNQAGGHFHSLALAAEIEERTSIEVKFSAGEEEHSFESETESSGSGEYEFSFELVE